MTGKHWEERAERDRFSHYFVFVLLSTEKCKYLNILDILNKYIHEKSFIRNLSVILYVNIESRRETNR